jgi:hypothetical protein
VIFQVLAVTNMNMTAVWDIAPCSFVETDWRFRSTYCILYQGDDCDNTRYRGSNQLQNVGQILGDTAPYRKRLSSLSSYVRLGPLNSLLSLGFPTTTVNALFISSTRAVMYNFSHSSRLFILKLYTSKALLLWNDKLSGHYPSSIVD